jgi:hypothetical protein
MTIYCDRINQKRGNKMIKPHRVKVEKAIGKPLRPDAPVHHHGGFLVACQDIAYHKLLHIRTEALKESGHADYRKCLFCKKYDSPENLVNISGKQNRNFGHIECRHKANQTYYLENKEYFREKNAKSNPMRYL